MKKQKFAIIDANAIIHRAFHALPPLQNKKGKLVNDVLGLAKFVKETIYNKTGMVINPEPEMVGFSEYELKVI